MKITFRLENEQEIIILGDGEKIGHIFSPSGTGHDKPDAVQICGFDDAFDYWGCGLFEDKSGKKKKDIQLLFSKDTRYHVGISNFGDVCTKCFNEPCSCKELERIKRYNELVADKV